MKLAVIVFNFLSWPVIHFGVSWLAYRFSNHSFRPHSWLYRERPFELNGNVYRDYLRVRKWKSRLPDGGSWLGSAFKKDRLHHRSPEYFQSFIIETCRSEWAHWVMFLFAPVFFIFNPLWAGWVMVGYASLANLPCIIVQRYNRILMTRVLNRMRGSDAIRT